ncbi:MAG: 4-hydroxy-tetrahydrodipicolinate reductase [Culturomica sp.]|jgi:4-hydroxy-tetrahydrodipicolinate reductase|nr:4-hydroxy-tetrahydrodipicolinate reductase [Culturomica sp.]
MKIALLGYGRMGRAIEKIAEQGGHTVILRIDVENREQITSGRLQEADVAIDFSVPAVAVDNYRWCFANRVPVVSGTTGWLERWEEVVACCREQNGGFFYASNFSLGVNLFFRLNRELARMMQHFPGYRAGIEEIHHIHKLDAPSGTAITLSEGILSEHSGYNTWQLLESGGKPGDETLPVKAVREGEVPGTHIVSYRSPVDEIRISHEAFSREGFAYGALLAAEFMKGKTGVYGMEDLLKAGDEQ